MQGGRLKLNFQIKTGTAPESRDSLIRELRKAGAADVYPLFPNESDAELASLYVAVPGQDAKALLRWLRARKEVAFAEEPAPRKLVR